ncbi:MAG: tRNA epoxyqueuosine(34) reductase QueG [Candidatus Sericytochromatia bacterium]|nr:tRNA epoxyqueuosine(34) reductase QueG [Candidatus Sericytochromatia bacterium]
MRADPDTLRAEASSLGFDAVGAAPAESSRYGPAFTQWLAQGFHGSMAWLARTPERRIDPRQVHSEARSIIAVYQRHDLPPAGPMPDDVPRGRVAAYALGEDYHDVMTPRLRLLAERLGDPLARAYVDTGPVLERSAAEAAGLGWIGRNCNLIVPGQGSFGFLGVLLTSLEYPVPRPVPITCGRCTACLAACPTGALVAPNTLDARLCISTLTIETRGMLTDLDRPRLGEWVYGCDLCQEACPWNRKAVPTRTEAFRARVDRHYPVLDELLGLSPEGFAARFRKSAIKRTRREGLARNAAVVLGNSRHPEAAPVLGAHVAHDLPVVRAHVAWALGRHGDRRTLVKMARTETDPLVQSEIDKALLGIC